MTSTSDWAELALLPGIDILNFSTVETSGDTTLAEMRERIIDLDQDIEQTAEGNRISIVQEMVLDASAADEIRLAIDKGCIGVTTVEVFNVVTGTPLLLERFSNETCQRQMFTVATSLFTTATFPRRLPANRLNFHVIYPIAPEGGDVVNWCEAFSPPQLCTHEMGTDEIAVVTEDLNFTELGARTWSPDGQQFLFSAGDESVQNLYVVEANGSNLRQLTNSGYSDYESEWAPDGEKIIFVRNCGLWSIRPDGSEEQLLMRSNDYCVETASWSPNSRVIAFTAFRDGAVRDIWRINADGGQAQRVYDFGDQPPRSGGLAWLPDNERILSWYWVDGVEDEQRLIVYADGSGVAGTVNGVPYWWERNYYPRWGIERDVVVETAVSTSPDTANLALEQLNDGSQFNRANVTAVATDPHNPDIIYAATGADGSIGNGAGVYKSTDGGATWSSANDGLERAAVYGLYIDPEDSNIIYATTFGAGLYKSSDGGQNWQASNEGMEQLTGWWGGVSMFLFDPADHTHLYHADPTSGIHYSTDSGESWQIINYTDMFLISMAIDPRDGRHLFAGAQYFGEGMGAGGLYESTDGGLFWEPIALDINSIAETSVANIAIDPNNPDNIIAFLDNDNRGISSRDGGESWREISIALFNKNVHGIAFDPANPSAIYLAAENVLMRSSDNGVSWQAVGNPLESNINALAFAGNRLYAGAHGVVWTDDGGSTWESAASNFGNTWLDLFADPTSGTLYAEDGGCRCTAPKMKAKPGSI